MTDILLQQVGVGEFNIQLDANDILADEGLETSVLLSLFTDRRLPSGEAPPDGTDDPRGWWGDIGDEDGVQMGSLLWLLWREKVLPSTASKARDYCAQALQWMIDDGIARAVTVDAERGGLYQLSIAIQIVRPDGDSLRYAYLWDGQRARLLRVTA